MLMLNEKGQKALKFYLGVYCKMKLDFSHVVSEVNSTINKRAKKGKSLTWELPQMFSITGSPCVFGFGEGEVEYVVIH